MNGLNSQPRASVPLPLLSPQVKPARKRPKPGERRTQILQTLATMLEKPGAERVTTAALAKQLEVSEAALYRHFASKAQMFEGLIEFIEQSILTLIEKASESGAMGTAQAREILLAVLQFSEKNPGMVRVMVGDALVFENERLVMRMAKFFDTIEEHLYRALVLASQGDAVAKTHATMQASVLTSFLSGRLQRFARSEFKRKPMEHFVQALKMLLG
jgi:TetR/AcrR family transcriptional regulator